MRVFMVRFAGEQIIGAADIVGIVGTAKHVGEETHADMALGFDTSARTD
jgi:hypothetical protein